MTATPLSLPEDVSPGQLATWIHEVRELCEDVEFGRLSHSSIAARLRVHLAHLRAAAYRKDPA